MWSCNYNGAGIGHWFWGGGLISATITIFIFLIIVALIIKLVKSNKSENSDNLDKKDSLKILKNRFAKGELSEQEYQRMKDILCI